VRKARHGPSEEELAATGGPRLDTLAQGIRDDDRGRHRNCTWYAQGGSTLSGGGTPGVEEAHNEIIEVLPEVIGEFRSFLRRQGRRGLVDNLCRSYREACEQERVPSLLFGRYFCFDFLSFTRFDDGNDGRVSRLVTTCFCNRTVSSRPLHQSGALGRRGKEDYYRVLVSVRAVGTKAETKFCRVELFSGSREISVQRAGDTSDGGGGASSEGRLVRGSCSSRTASSLWLTSRATTKRQPATHQESAKRVEGEGGAPRGRGRGATWSVIG